MTDIRIAAAGAALCAALWGTTYSVFTQTLPVEHPLLVSVLRALPAGVLLMAIGAGLPPRRKLLRLTVLGFANIGLFFGLLLVAAARLPGGVAATLSSCQPLIVAFLAWPLLGRRPIPAQVAAAIAGLLGVALLVLTPGARFDAVGVLAALGSAVSMAFGTTLTARWRDLGSPLQIAAWQLWLGGLVLLPFALLAEGLPPPPTARNVAGLTVLVLFGTALAYWLWVRCIDALGADTAFLGLLSPLVATLIGAALLGEWLRPVQWLGIAVILGATLAGLWLGRRRARALAA